MAKNETIFFTKEGRFASGNSSGALTTIITAGPDGSKLLGLHVVANSNGINISVQINSELMVSLGAVSGLDLLQFAPLDCNGNHYYNLPPLATVEIDVTGVLPNTTVGAYLEDY